MGAGWRGRKPLEHTRPQWETFTKGGGPHLHLHYTNDVRRRFPRNVQVELSQVSVSSASVGFWNHEVSSSFPNVLSILQLPKLIIKVTLQLKMRQSLLVFKVIDRR